MYLIPTSLDYFLFRSIVNRFINNYADRNMGFSNPRDGLSLEFELQQVSSSLQNPSQYSGCSQ